MRNFKHKAYEYRWALLSGFFVGTSYIPFPPWALLFCLTPLWLTALTDSRSLKKVFLQGWVTQFTLTMIGFHWIAHTAHEFGELPWSISIAALLLFAGFMHLHIAMAPLLGAWLKRRFQLSSIQTLFVIALIHSLLERVWPAIFQWNLGYTFLWSKIPIYNLADIIGFEGLASVILLFNAWVGVVWLLKDQAKKSLPQLTALVATFALLIIAGYWHGQEWNKFDGSVKALIIQANIGNHDKIQAERGHSVQSHIIRRFTTLSREAFQTHPDSEIMLWPETAFPDYLDQHFNHRPHVRMMVEQLRPVDIPLFVGGYSKDLYSPNNQDQSTYNSLFLIDAQANNLSSPIRKNKLLAFGEYLPLTETFPIILKWLPFVANFGRGPGPTVVPWTRSNQDTVRWGGECYEGLFPGFTRGLAAQSADILINVTNDSWFGKTFEPSQHLYMTLARAIEVRRPLIRSTNTGISTAILANGQVLQKSPLHKEWFGQLEIKYKKEAPQTLFSRGGHYDWVILLTSLGLLLLQGFRHARTRRP